MLNTNDEQQNKFPNESMRVAKIIALLEEWTNLNFKASGLVDFRPFFNWINGELLFAKEKLEVWVKENYHQRPPPYHAVTCFRFGTLKEEIEYLRRLLKFARGREFSEWIRQPIAVGPLKSLEKDDKIRFIQFVDRLSEYQARFNLNQTEINYVRESFNHLDVLIKASHLVRELFEVEHIK